MPANDFVPPLTNEAAIPLADPSVLLQAMEVILTTSSDPVFLVDRQGRFLRVGLAVERALGLPASEIVGTAMQACGFDPEVTADLVAQTERVFHTKQTVTGTALIRTVFGPRLYEYQFSPLLDDHGEVTTMLCMARDVTDRNMAEAERTLRQEVQAAKKETNDASVTKRSVMDSLWRMPWKASG
jgi:PAS domain S-box-containing protein